MGARPVDPLLRPGGRAAVPEKQHLWGAAAASAWGVLDTTNSPRMGLNPTAPVMPIFRSVGESVLMPDQGVPNRVGYTHRNGERINMLVRVGDDSDETHT